MIPLTVPYVGMEEEQAASEVIRSGWLSQGKKVEEFEQAIASYTGTNYAVATSSCTTALHIALLSMGVAEGDEILCPSYTFVATANAVLYCGGKPVLTDIDTSYFNLDPEKAKDAITDKTRGIVLVHQLGLPADIDAFKDIAHEYGLWIIEDAAAAIGSEYKGKRIGGHTAVSCFSFHPRKIITTGEGGIITTNDPEVYETLLRLRNHGASVDSFKRHQSKGIVFEEYTDLGYNYRLSDVHAAIGIEQVKKLENIVRLRREKAGIYNELLKGSNVECPGEPVYAQHNYTTYQILIRKELQKHRDLIIEQMHAKGVSLRRGIPPIHKQPYFEKMFGVQNLPVTEDISNRALFLPLFPALTYKEQQYVVDALNETLQEVERT